MAIKIVADGTGTAPRVDGPWSEIEFSVALDRCACDSIEPSASDHRDCTPAEADYGGTPLLRVNEMVVVVNESRKIA